VKRHQRRDFCLFPYVDSAPVDGRGADLVFNALYCFNLRATASMAKILSKAAAKLEEQAKSVGQILTKDYWDENTALFSDTIVNGQRSEMTGEPSQSIMLYAELADREQARSIVRIWQQRPEQLPKTDITFLEYTVEGSAKYGYTAFALQLLRARLIPALRERHQFGEMQAQVAARFNTFYERLPDASWAQGLWVTGAQPGLRARRRSLAPAFLLRRVADCRCSKKKMVLSGWLRVAWLSR